MKNIMILVLILTFGLYSLESAAKTKNNVSLLLSELTVDKVPGDNGSWIELYNPGDKPIDANGIIIVCNNREIYKFPKTIIPSKFLVLIKFSKDADGSIEPDSEDRIVRINSKVQTKAVKLDYKKIFKQPPFLESCTKSEKERTPGYCALFKKDISQKNIMDFVAWGYDYLTKYDDSVIKRKHFEWANKQRIWKEGELSKLQGVFIGVDAGPGADPWPRENAVIARMHFSKTENVNNCWQVVCPKLSERLGDSVTNQKITPGKPNKWFVPSLDVDGAEWKKKDEIAIDESRHTIDLRRFELEKEEKGFFRLQIATDPYFEELIYDRKIELTAIIDKKILKPKRYYARARVEMKRCKTDWSPICKFSYELKQEE